MSDTKTTQEYAILEERYDMPATGSVIIPDCLVRVEEPTAFLGNYLISIMRGNDKLIHTLPSTPNDKDLIGMAAFIDSAITELYKYFPDLDTTDIKARVMHDCNHTISIEAVDYLRMDGAVDYDYIQICHINSGDIDANAKARLVVVLGRNGKTIAHLSSESLKQMLNDHPETLVRSSHALRLLDVALELGDGEKLYDTHDTYGEVVIDPSYRMMTNTQRLTAKLNRPDCTHFDHRGVEMYYKVHTGDFV